MANLYEAFVVGVFVGFIAGLYAAVWYINHLRRAAGLRTI